MAGRAVGCAGGSPQNSLDPSEQLSAAEGLSDVVVCTQLQAEHLVDLVSLGREHDDRHLALRAQAPANLDPVDLRQHAIEHDHIIAIRRRLQQAITPIGRHFHDMACLTQAFGDMASNVEVVFDQQDMHRRTIAG